MSSILEIAKQILVFLFEHLLFWNMLFAVIIVFFERRNPKSVWGWLLLMFFIPILGFVLYLFL
ncbi:MAG: PLDc N-terminal domain-containing protein, partial [Acetatifactor sp.]|nr:PLDc N-terminal domain-containing protein [Acetatifactor sp.]